MANPNRRKPNRNSARQLRVESLDKRELFAVDTAMLEPMSATQFAELQNNTTSSILSSSTTTIDNIERLQTEQGRFDFRISGKAVSGSLVKIEQPNRGVLTEVNANVLGRWTADVQNVALVDRAFSFQARATLGNPGTTVSSDIEKFQPNI